jgi:hypothetical protein
MTAKTSRVTAEHLTPCNTSHGLSLKFFKCRLWGTRATRDRKRALQICSKAPAKYFGLARDDEVIHGQTIRPNRSKHDRGYTPIGTAIECQQAFGLDGQGSSRQAPRGRVRSN